MRWRTRSLTRVLAICRLGSIMKGSSSIILATSAAASAVTNTKSWNYHYYSGCIHMKHRHRRLSSLQTVKNMHSDFRFILRQQMTLIPNMIWHSTSPMAHLKSSMHYFFPSMHVKGHNFACVLIPLLPIFVKKKKRQWKADCCCPVSQFYLWQVWQKPGHGM